MFKKVLIAEDMLSINEGIKSALISLGIPEIIHVQYCDDALLKIKRALIDNQPFDLFISDLSFKKDYRDQKITSGDELLDVIKKLQPNIKTIAYSIEDRPQKIRNLFSNQHIDGYVCKDRNGLKELLNALEHIYNGKKFVSPQIESAVKSNVIIELDTYDIKLLKQLANGLTQEEIASYFKRNNTTPNSTSSIEKRLNKLKIDFKANNTIHLVAIVKDFGFI